MRAVPPFAIALLVLAFAAPAMGAGESYIAMGDSYSSGTGTREYFDPDCERSNHAYGPLIEPQVGSSFRMTACGGARTAHILNTGQNGNPPQADLLGASTEYVSISIGGNDAGFSSTLLECGQPEWASDCGSAMADSRNVIDNELPGRLNSVLTRIRDRAPDARVALVGYPRIFPADGDDCSAATFFTSSEMRDLNALADRLADVARAAARARGMTFVDAREPYMGHAWCEDEWINGLSNPTNESYHPNRNGHSLGYRGIVREALLAAPAPADARGPNGRIAFSRSGDIWVMNPDGSFPVQLTSGAASDLEPQFSPDGDSIAFASDREGGPGGDYDIHTMALDGSGVTQLTADGSNRQPAWSPNGDRITFISNRDGNDEVFRMTASGGSETQLTHTTAGHGGPVWSPDGAEIAYQRGNDIWKMQADGQGQLNLTNHSATDERPAWSPDGAKIAFASNRNDSRFEIFTIGATGGSVTRLTSDAGNDDRDPAYSPDGSQITFRRTAGGVDRVATMTASGGAQAFRSPGSDLTPDWQGDKTPPPTTLGPASATYNTATPTFTFSSTEIGVSFQCQVDSGAWSACASPFTTQPLSQGDHTIRVRARDAAGNLDASPASHAFLVDTAAAEVRIDSGPSGPVSDTTPTFRFSTGEAGATFECRVDTAAFAPCTDPHTLPEQTQGPHTFEVRTRDGANNVSAPVSRGFVVDTVNPAVSADFGPPARSNSRDPEFRFSADEADVTFECRLQGTGGFDSGWQACTSPHRYTSVPEGSYFFSLRGRDAANNASATVQWLPQAPLTSAQFTIDTTAPTVSITGGPPAGTDNPIATSSTSFTFTSEPNARFECRLDSDDEAGWNACSSPHALTGLRHGVHEFEVRAIDQFGNPSAPATRTFGVDTEDPTLTITTFPGPLSNDPSPEIEFTSSDRDAALECRVDDAAWQDCASPFDPGTLGDGQHTFDLRATDVFGDPVTEPRRTWTIDTSPPGTEIVSGPSGATRSTSASFTFSSEQGATFQCSLDGGPFAACPASHSLTGLGQGQHTLVVRARDAAGNVDASPDSRAWTVDTVAPGVSVSGPSSPTRDTSATLTFSSPDATATLTCTLDGTAVTPCASSHTATVGHGPHTFTVVARDAAGNESTASHTWSVDTQGPATTLGAGGPSGATNQTSATFTFSSPEQDARFECSWDGGATYAACTSGETRSNLADGAHSFHVRALDTLGNAGSAASRSWTVDTQAPQVNVDGPASPSRDSTPTLEFSSPDGTATLTCTLDGSAVTPCTSPRTLTVADGSHTFTVRATDAAGNFTTDSHTWTVDTEAPSLTLDPGGPSGVTRQTSATFTFSKETGAAVECSWGNEPFAACSSPASRAGLADGAHRFRVRARDEAGNERTTEPRTWTVDTQPPAPTFLDKPPETTDRTSARFEFAADGATFECALDDAPFGPCSSPQVVTVEPGAHRFRVRATDAAGNASTITHEWSVQAPAQPPPPPPDDPPAVNPDPPSTPPQTPRDPTPPPVARPGAKVTWVKGTIRLPSSGRATVATISCPRARCTISAPTSVRVTVGRVRHTFTVSASRALSAGRSGRVILGVPRAARAALRGRTVSVVLRLTVTEAAGRVPAKGTVKLQGPRR